MIEDQTTYRCIECGDPTFRPEQVCTRCLLADRADSDAVSRRLETETAWLGSEVVQ